MKESEQRQCKRCLMKEDIKNGITIDNRGVCSLCRQAENEKDPDWTLLKDVFENTLEENRGKGKEYDGVVMMSGGKDSAYLACTLKKKYNLRIIGFVNDIHYEYSKTFEGAKKICDKLDMPLIINKFPEDKMRKYFKFLFLSKELRDSGFGHICNYCGRFMIRSAGDFAAENGIPMVFSGHNPQQIFEMGESYEVEPNKIAKQKAIRENIAHSVEMARNLAVKEYADILDYFPESLFPEEVKGMFMYHYFPYNPAKMMEYIQKEIDWQPYTTLSSTYIASGCKLAHLWTHLASKNNMANYVDKEFSAQIRNGVLSKKLVKSYYENAVDSTDMINEILEDLQIDSIESILEEDKNER